MCSLYLALRRASSTSLSSAISVALALRSQCLLLWSCCGLAYLFISHTVQYTTTLQETCYVTPPILCKTWQLSMRRNDVPYPDRQTPSALESQLLYPLAPIMPSLPVHPSQHLVIARQRSHARHTQSYIHNHAVYSSCLEK